MRYRAPLVTALGVLLACASHAPAQDATAQPATPPAPAALPLPATRPVERPVPAIARAMIISIDGLRPDVMLRAPTPNLRQLVDGGAFSFWARTTDIAVTLPSHCSMLTGVPPEKHGIFWNDKPPADGPVRPSYPTLLELAKAAGYTTAIAAGKSKFDALAPGADHVYVAATDTATVTGEAVAIIRQHRPQVMTIHFPGVDGAGHKDGWGTPQQIEQIRIADEGVGQVLAALREQGVLDETFVLISTDHGGQGRSHGKDDMRSRYIPWIASGPGIRRGIDLTIYKELNVRTEDTFATACWLLGLVPPRPVDGRPVTQILEQDELLQPATPAAAGAR